MPDRFVALPVGQGDAFFLQRGAFTALIDGGKSVHSFSTLYSEVLNRKSVGVLVCTHNDADHANGVLGFLESGLGCDEVWLPALWTDRLQDLIARPNEFLEELVDDIDREGERLKAQYGDADGLHLADLGDAFADGYDRESQDPETVPDMTPAEPVRPMAVTLSEDGNGYDELFWPESLGRRRLRVATSPFRIWTFEDDEYHLFLQAISAAERIRLIGVACAHRGVPVRWFRHSLTEARGGRRGLLTPLNAVEVAPGPSTGLGALRYLALSASNRLSLAFCSPPTEANPGAVFTADSDLDFATPVPWREGMIVTAPHHGSEANATAYTRYRAETNGGGEPIWVRSDGNFRTRPGPSYLEQANRFCTLCPGVDRPKQAIRFSLLHGAWRPVVCPRCACG